MVLSFIVHSYKTTYEKNRVGRRLVWAAALWKEKKNSKIFFWTFRNKSDKNKFTKFSKFRKNYRFLCDWVVKAQPKKGVWKRNSKRKLFWDQKKGGKKWDEKGTDHRLDNKH